MTRAGMAALALGVCLSVPGWAHAGLFGTQPTPPIVNVPIDTSAAIAPFPQAQLTRPAPEGWSTFFTRFFSPTPLLNQLPRNNVRPRLQPSGSFGVNPGR